MKTVIALLIAMAAMAETDVVTQLVGALERGDFDAATQNFDARMKAALTPDKLAQLWHQLGFVKQKGTRHEKAGGMDIYYVACEFASATLDLKIAVNNTGQIAGFFIVPHTDPQPLDSSDRAVQVAGLPGILKMPEGPGPFPAVILVHGSGPQDRDETIGATKPFRDLAYGLPARGIAVLRYDKRTLLHPESFGPNSTVKEEVIDDAVAAFRLLQHTSSIDPKRIFVLGHSLGGMLMPRIAKQIPDAAGFIIMAGNTRPLDQVALEQFEYLKPPNIESVRQEIAKVRTIQPGDPPLLGAPASYWIDLRGYHPAEAAKDVHKPLLILQGERDYQVSMKDFAGWKAAVPGATLKSYPRLNHLFMAGDAPSTPAEYNTPGHVSDEVIADIANWIHGQSAK